MKKDFHQKNHFLPLIMLVVLFCIPIFPGINPVSAQQKNNQSKR